MQTPSNGHSIAKLQHFSDYLQQLILEKESLALLLTDKSVLSDIRTEIIVYTEILDKFNKLFEDILHKE